MARTVCMADWGGAGRSPPRRSRLKSLSSLAHESKAVPKSQRRRKRRTPVPIASKLAIPCDVVRRRWTCCGSGCEHRSARFHSRSHRRRQSRSYRPAKPPDRMKIPWHLVRPVHPQNGRIDQSVTVVREPDIGGDATWVGRAPAGGRSILPLQLKAGRSSAEACSAGRQPEGPAGWSQMEISQDRRSSRGG